MDSALTPVIASGDLVPLYKIVGDDFSALDASTPDLSDYLRPDAPDSVVAFIRSARGMGRAFFAPPATDPADVAALRDLLEAIVTDPQFIHDAQLKGIPIAAKSGAVLTQQIEALIPKDEAARSAILNTYACGLEMSVNPRHECNF
jgi:tripartite-type tricarboxylate transporter receptor subunit TctC